MANQKSIDQETLEGFIDRYGLNRVLDMMAEITGQKIGHLVENWQDTNQAKAWDRACGVLLKASDAIPAQIKY